MSALQTIIGNDDACVVQRVGESYIEWKARESERFERFAAELETGSIRFHVSEYCAQRCLYMSEKGNVSCVRKNTSVGEVIIRALNAWSCYHDCVTVRYACDAATYPYEREPTMFTLSFHDGAFSLKEWSE